MPDNEDNFERVYNFYLAAVEAGIYSDDTGVFGGADLPTSASGLAAGTLYNDSLTVKIVT